SSEHDQALEMARTLHAESGQATQVIEECIEREAERLTVRVLAQHGAVPSGTKGPSTDSNIASRIIIVILNAFGIGAIGTVVMAIALSSFRESGAAVGNSFNMLLLFTFAAIELLAGLTLFRIYVPTQWILWRGKSPE